MQRRNPRRTSGILGTVPCLIWSAFALSAMPNVTRTHPLASKPLRVIQSGRTRAPGCWRVATDER